MQKLEVGKSNPAEPGKPNVTAYLELIMHENGAIRQTSNALDFDQMVEMLVSVAQQDSQFQKLLIAAISQLIVEENDALIKEIISAQNN